MPSHRLWSRSIVVVAAFVLTALIVPTSPAHAVRSVDRIDGPDRYAASAAMSRSLTGATSTVFLVSGQSYPDALAAAPVVTAERARMLLTAGHTIPTPIQRELQRLTPTRIVLVGGEPTISAAVHRQAAAIVPGVRIERIGGANRVETSMLLLDRLRKTRPAADVWVASGRNFPDALAAGAVAARLGHGLVLTLGADAQFRQAIDRRLTGTSRFLVVGSAASVGDDVQSLLRQTNRPVQRIAGANRYETAVAVNQAFTTSAPNGRILLASGANFPDALGGAVVSGATGSPLYLTNPACASTDTVLWETRRIGATGVVALGGPPSVSEAAAQLRGCDRDATRNDLEGRIGEVRASLPTPAQQLSRSTCLDAVAQGWANQMAARQLGSVHNPNLTADARSCGMKSWSEIVGRTVGVEPNLDRMMTMWMESLVHRNSIHRASSEHIGIGMARSSTGYWNYVVVFGVD